MKRNNTIKIINKFWALIIIVTITVATFAVYKHPELHTEFAQPKTDYSSTVTVTDEKYGEIQSLSGKEIRELIEQIAIGKEANPATYHRKDWKPGKHRMHVWDKTLTIKTSYRDWSGLHNTDREKSLPNTMGFCLYTNKVMNLKDMQYDHIIPLKYANDHGASNWSNEKKVHYATDLSVALTVSGHENMAKGAKGPAEYIPEKNRAEYALTWLLIAKEYGLSLDAEDMEVIKNELKNVKDDESTRRINTYDEDPYYK